MQHHRGRSTQPKETETFLTLVTNFKKTGKGSWQTLKKNVENTYHGHVDIAGMQLHVDLLVDESLAGGMVVCADFG